MCLNLTNKFFSFLKLHINLESLQTFANRQIHILIHTQLEFWIRFHTGQFWILFYMHRQTNGGLIKLGRWGESSYISIYVVDHLKSQWFYIINLFLSQIIYGSKGKLREWWLCKNQTEPLKQCSFYQVLPRFPRHRHSRVHIAHCFFNLPSRSDIWHLLTIAKACHKSTPNFKGGRDLHYYSMPRKRRFVNASNGLWKWSLMHSLYSEWKSLWIYLLSSHI